MTFDKCSHFQASFDRHDMCASCRAKEGRPECTREDNCMAYVSWDDVIWDLYEKNIQRRQRAKQRKIEKTRTSSMSSEDSVLMHPEGEVDFDKLTPGGTSQVKSVLTVPKRHSPALWDTDVEDSPRKRPRQASRSLAVSGRSSVVGVTLVAGTELLLITINPLGVLLERSDPFQRAGSTGGVSTQAMKSPPMVNIVSSSGDTAVSSSTSTSASMQSQSSMELPSTGMDMQWRDLMVQNDPLSSGLPQMWADDLH